ncbi:MAG: alpha/beta fold hydrolase [Gammaproteobacteria bacterium]|nr:alpha/beta fold hydrolase [Gammaproteobacteria bacterium]NNJ49542.1 alpha/beta fold hydrolase [Gammaproteobacteria bacterium]
MMISRSWQLMICTLIIAGFSGMAFCADNAPVQARSLHVPYSIPLKDITLEGYLVSSDNTSYASTVIIILHGWFSEDVNGARAYLSYANRLASAGFTAITVSMRGWPDTGGIDDCGHKQSLDLVEAVEWLKNRSALQLSNIGIVGFSQGGQVSLLTTAKSDQLDFTVAYFPVTDINAWQKSSNIKGITHDYIPNTCAQAPGKELKSPINHVRSISTPVLFIHGDEDLRVPTEQSISMVDKMKQMNKYSELLIIKAAGHGDFSAEQSQLAFDTAVDFIHRSIE